MLIILLAYVYYFQDLQTLEKNYCRTFVKDCEGNLKTINVYFFFKVEYHKFCHNILYFSIHMYTHHLLLQEASRNCIIGAEPGMAISGHSLLFTGKCDHHDSTKEANYGRPPSQLLVPAYRNLAHFFGKVRLIGCLHSSSDREEERN